MPPAVTVRPVLSDLTFCADEIPLLTAEAALPCWKSRRSRRFERYYRACAAAFANDCRCRIFPQAERLYRQALETAQSLPQWHAQLRTVLTFQTADTVSLYTETSLTCCPSRSVFRRSDTWDLRRGLPLRLQELFPPRTAWRSLLLQTAAQQIEEAGFEGQADVDSYLDNAEKSVLEISRNRRTSAFLSPDEVFSGVLAHIQKMSESGSTITGLSSGFRDFDRITHGFQRGDLIILAARPSMGKTAVALNFAMQTADHNRNAGAVAIFSLEQPAEQIGMRLLSARSRVNGDHIKTGRLSNDEWNAVNEAAVDLKNLNLYIEDTSTIKVSEIFSKCRQLQADKGLALVVIDYIQFITGSGNSRDYNRQQEVSDISRSLKSLARELNVPVIALSQLSRGVEQRVDKRPMLSDLRESGAIEQDADIVMMLYRDSYYNEEAKTQAKENGSEQLEINIAKHRNGETGRFFLAFEGSTNACMNYAAQYGE